MHTQNAPSPAMKLFVPSIGSITQFRPLGFLHSKVIEVPVSDSSPMIPSSWKRARSPATICRCAARSASVTASSLAAAWVLVRRSTFPYCCRTIFPAPRARSVANCKSCERLMATSIGRCESPQRTVADFELELAVVHQPAVDDAFAAVGLVGDGEMRVVVRIDPSTMNLPRFVIEHQSRSRLHFRAEPQCCREISNRAEGFFGRHPK